MKRHVILIGLPGSGKTTVGRLVAEQLQATFVDVDALLVRKEGKPVTMIFAEKGEAAFRELERKEVETALAAPPAVIAPGGGWAAHLRPAKASGSSPEISASARRPSARTATPITATPSVRWWSASATWTATTTTT